MERTGPPHEDDPSGDRPPDQEPQGPQSPSGPPQSPSAFPPAPQPPGAPQSPRSPPGPPPAPQPPGAPQSPSAFPPAPQPPGGPPAAPPASPGGLQAPGGYAGPTPPGGWQQPTGATATADPNHGAKFGLGRAWGFTILSFGLWGYYWFYVTRKQMDSELGGHRDDALLHTLGLIVPILNFFIIYWLWRDISLVRGRAGLSEFSPGGYLAGLIIGAFFIIGLPLFYSLVLDKLNEYWDRRAGGRAPDHPSTTAEKVVVGIGLVLMVLYVFFIIIIVIIGAAASSSGTSAY